MKNTPLLPENEWDRVIKLYEFDMDYWEIQDALGDLTELAAKVAGTEISLVNLIDSYTQWTVSNYGLPFDHMPREDFACQYTIAEKEFFEVKDLSADLRFKDKFYVNGDPKLRYYFGVPIKTDDGHSLGALCVLDKNGKELSPEKIELLKIIANEIVKRLMAMKVIEKLRSEVRVAAEKQKKAAHDICGPMSGIIGLAKVISEIASSKRIDEVKEFSNLIEQSGNSLVEMVNDILTVEVKNSVNTLKNGSDALNLSVFKQKLEKLYAPQAVNKNIDFSIQIHSVSSESDNIPFSKNKVQQITVNLVANAMKFTSANGKIALELNLIAKPPQNILQIIITDSGIGMDEQAINNILQGEAVSTRGTAGETGYGFGLALVKHLVDGMNGTMQIHSASGEGTRFEIQLPQNLLES